MRPPEIIPLESALEQAGSLLYHAKHPTQVEIDGVIRCLEAFDDPRAADAIEELRQIQSAAAKGSVGK